MGKLFRSTFRYEGKRYERTSTVNQREADKKADRLLEQLKNGTQGISKKMTVKRWSEEYLETYKKGNCTDKVYADYEYKIGLVTDRIGSLKLSDVTDLHLQKILNEYAGYSTDYVATLRRLIKAMFKQARISRIIIFDLAEALKMPKTKKGTHRSITNHEREHILKVAETHPAGLWVKIMLYCGLRPGETVPLRWMDLDFDKHMLSITQAKESGSSTIKETKSKAGIRKIPIPDVLYFDLIERRRDPFEYIVTKQTSNDILTDMSMRCLWNSFKKDVDKSMGAVYDKVEAKDGRMRTQLVMSVVAPDLVPYCMRHTYGTDLQDAKVPINVAKELMDHSDISVTGNIYTHLTDEAIAQSLEAINKHHGICTGVTTGVTKAEIAG